MSPVQGKSPLVRVNEPHGKFRYGYCKLESTPADNTHDCVWQYIEKEIFFFFFNYIPVLEGFLIMHMEMGVEKQF